MEWLRRASGLFLPQAHFAAPWRFLPCPNCCCPAVCSACLNSCAPEEWEVVVQDVANGTCSDCADLNDTYIVTPEVACIWRHVLDPVVCNLTIMKLLIIGSYIFVRFYDVAGSNKLEFRQAYGSPPDCVNLSDEDLPYYSSDGRCDGAAATCTITAL